MLYFCKDTISPDAPKLLKHDLIWTYGIKHSKHMSKYRLLMKKYSTTLLVASDRLGSLLLCAHRARGGGADWEHKSMVLRHDNVLVWMHNSDSEFRSYKQTPSDVTAVFLHNSSHSFVFLLEGTNTSSTCWDVPGVPASCGIFQSPTAVNYFNLFLAALWRSSSH